MAARSVSRTGAPSTPVVTRRIVNNSPGPTPAPVRNLRVPRATPQAGGQLRPTVRQTFESIISSGSQVEYSKPEQTIILLDWDDTLCPSNWIRTGRPHLDYFKPAPRDERFQRPLRELQKHVAATLNLALKLGKVVIVTNAMDPWVELSCKNFLPELTSIVKTIPVIYARSVYESNACDSPMSRSRLARSSSPGGRGLPGLYTASGHNKLGMTNAKLAMQSDALLPQRWKELVFSQEISGFYSRYEHQSWKNIISIGDSIFERDAVRRVVLCHKDGKKKCRIKTCKLLDEPEIEELIAQVRLIHDALGQMVHYDGNLDVEIDESDLTLDVGLAGKIMDR
eukprot:TRINITY_DN21330_c0_g1_i1.p1 TRINITY_DN21330_c0_g1~~TRINITY_DN21330_c0_g1_i1.p1  ORF type:complete len:348 (+),score=50.99 TRINITY_DN21330_c0_g1_i1:30-1046(+)